LHLVFVRNVRLFKRVAYGFVPACCKVIGNTLADKALADKALFFVSIP